MFSKGNILTLFRNSEKGKLFWKVTEWNLSSLTYFLLTSLPHSLLATKRRHYDKDKYKRKILPPVMIERGRKIIERNDK